MAGKDSEGPGAEVLAGDSGWYDEKEGGDIVVGGGPEDGKTGAWMNGDGLKEFGGNARAPRRDEGVEIVPVGLEA